MSPSVTLGRTDVAQYWLLAIVGGVVSTVIYVLAGHGAFGGMLLAYFAPLPVFAVGLGLGAAAGTVSSLVAAVIMLTVGGVVAASVYVLMNAIPVIILLRQAMLSRTNEQGDQDWYPSGHLIVAASTIAAVIFTIGAFWFETASTGLEDTVRTFVADLVQQVAPNIPDDQMEPMVQMVSQILPGFIGASWLIMIVINGALAQSALVRFGKNLRPSPSLISMEFPQWFLILTAIAAAMAAILPAALGFFGQNLMIILIAPFFFMGLAVVHAVCRKRPSSTVLLVTFYAFLTIFGWPAIFVVLLGLIEQWAGFRRRFA
jgi:hypothetical protein